MDECAKIDLRNPGVGSLADIKSNRGRILQDLHEAIDDILTDGLVAKIDLLSCQCVPFLLWNRLGSTVGGAELVHILIPRTAN